MSAPAGQAVASRPTVSAWVDASAGTGKTKVLADRVLRLLLAGTPPERILALTFTRAAAAEMANRIFDALGAWSAMPDRALEGALAGLLEEPPDAAAAVRARGLFLRVLDAPGGVKIQTIHSFCQSVLGRFPLEARVDPHFSVMDERTGRETLRRARDAAIAGARRDPDSPLARAFAIVAARAGETVFDSLTAALAGERDKVAALAERARPDIEAATHRHFGLEPDETEGTILAAAAEEGAFDRGGLARAAEALLGGRKTDVAAGTAIAAWLERPLAAPDAFADYARAFLTQDGNIRKRFPTKGVAERAPGAVDAWRAEAERVRAVRQRVVAARTAAESAALARIGAALLASYRDEKARRGRLDYDDLIAGVQRLVEDEAAAQWVLYKLDGGIDHVLIDEAQDTNPRQWAVVRALAADFFAGESAREETRTVFAVGDPKQSIYSFQGVEAGAFAAAREAFRARVEESGAAWEDVELGRSFRSTRAVLRAVDAVFADADARRGLGERPVRHAVVRTGQAGLVTLWPPAGPHGPEDADPWQAAGRLFGHQTASYRLAEAIAAKIDGWLESGERLESRGRAMTAGDIMVLVRHRSEIVDHLVRALKQRKVGVAGVDRLVLSTQLAVMDLLALADAALMIGDDLTVAAVLKGPLAGLDETALFDLAHERGKPLAAALADRRGEPPYARADAVLREVLAMADFAPPYEFFSRILGPMGGRERIVARLGPDAEDPIDEFLALALDYEREHSPSLQGFVSWFRGARTEVKRDLEQAARDEVRVLTVHGAKGLQAPVVVLADAIQKPVEREPLLWSETDPPILVWKRRQDSVSDALAAARRARSEEEYRRLLYVAMTRAEDRLYVAGYNQRKSAPPDDCWYSMVERALRPIAKSCEMTLEAPENEIRGPGLILEERQTAPPDRARAADTGAPAAPPLPDWVRRPAPAEAAVRPALRPSRLDGDGAPAGSPGREAAVRRGRIVHDILRRIPAPPPADPRPVVEARLARPGLALSAGERRRIADEIAALFADPAVAALFAAGSMAEVPVVGRIAGRAYSGSIDRLVVAEEVVRAVEFKTDPDPPAAAEGIRPRYLRQIAAYRALLAEVYPGRRIECTLVWTAGPTAMTVPDALLDAG